MEHMFSNCFSLKELNLTNFNTDNIINMNNRFSDYLSMEELDLSIFNTHNSNNINVHQ